MVLTSLCLVSLVLWVLLAYVAVPLPLQDELFAWLRRQWLVEGVVLLACAAALSAAWSQRRQLPARPAWWRAWWLWLLWAVASIAWSIDRGLSLRAGVAFAGYGLLAYAISSLIRTPRELSLWVKFLVGVGLVTMLEGAFQYAGTFQDTLALLERLQSNGQAVLQGWGAGVIEDFLRRRRIFSVFGWPNLFAGFLLLVMPLAIGLRQAASTRRARWAWTAAAGLMVLSLVLTLSMGGWIAAILTVCVVWGLQRSPRWQGLPRSAPLAGPSARCGSSRSQSISASPANGTHYRRLVTVLLTGIVLCGVVSVTSYIVAKRARPLITASTSSRLIYVRSAAGVIRAHPLGGTGLGTYGIAYRQFLPDETVEGQHAALHAHNTLAEVAADLGLIGLVLFLGLLRSVWRLIASAIHAVGAPPESWLRWGLAVGLLGFFVHGLIEQTFVEAVTAPFWWLALGLLSGTVVSEEAAAPARQSWAPVWLLAITALALTARLAVADAWTAQGAVHDLGGRPAQAQQAFAHAQRWDPWATRYALERAVRLLKRRPAADPTAAQQTIRQAGELFHEATRLSPRFSYAWLRVGTSAWQLGDLTQARLPLERAVRFDPNSRAAWWHLAQLAQATGRFEELRRIAQRGAQLEPLDHRWVFLEAVAWEGLHQPDRAAAVYRQLLQRTPAFYPAWYNLAQLLQRQGQRQGAREAYTVFLSLAPPEEEAARAAAQAYVQQSS